MILSDALILPITQLQTQTRKQRRQTLHIG